MQWPAVIFVRLKPGLGTVSQSIRNILTVYKHLEQSMTSVLTLIFLQITQATDTLVTTTAPDELSIFELMMKGGFVMIPIIALLIIATYIFIERFLYVRVASKAKKDFITNIANYLQAGEIKTSQYWESLRNHLSSSIQK